MLAGQHDPVPGQHVGGRGGQGWFGADLDLGELGLACSVEDGLEQLADGRLDVLGPDFGEAGQPCGLEEGIGHHRPW